MAVSTTCGCGKILRVRDEHAGRSIKCPECGARVQLPPAASPPMPPPAGPPEPPLPAVVTSSDVIVASPNAGHEAAVQVPSLNPAVAVWLLIVSEVRATARVYRDHWSEILRVLGDYAPRRFVDDEYRWRQIRLTRESGWKNERWDADLPGACIACGYRQDLNPARRSLAVIDARRPARAVLLAAGTGLLVLVAWNLWWWALYLVLMPVVLWWGARRSTAEPVRLEFCRCEEHVASREWPQAYREGNELVIVAGHTRVRKLWLRSQREESPPVPPEVVREALARARQEDAERSARGPVAARMAGWIWLATGYLQWLSAALEFLAIMAGSITLGPGNVAGPILFLIVYASFRFKVAEAFRNAGRETLDQDADDVLSNGIGSLGIGILFLIPGTLVALGIDLVTFDVNQIRSDPVAVALLISLAGWGLLLSTAGLLALVGRRAYLGISTGRRQPICELPCPMCRGTHKVYDTKGFENLVVCEECGEAFRFGA